MQLRNPAEKNRDRKPVESGRISIEAHPEVSVPACTFTRPVVYGAKRVCRPVLCRATKLYFISSATPHASIASFPHSQLLCGEIIFWKEFAESPISRICVSRYRVCEMSAARNKRLACVWNYIYCEVSITSRRLRASLTFDKYKYVNVTCIVDR